MLLLAYASSILRLGLVVILHLFMSRKEFMNKGCNRVKQVVQSASKYHVFHYNHKLLHVFEDMFNLIRYKFGILLHF